MAIEFIPKAIPPPLALELYIKTQITRLRRRKKDNKRRKG
jgi:hypothetical protein